MNRSHKAVFYAFVCLLILILLPIHLKTFFAIAGDANLVQATDNYQDYLFAHAVKAGLDPYRSLSVLHDAMSDMNLGSDMNFGKTLLWYKHGHATPHPPTVFPFIFWMSWVSPQVAYVLWALIEFGCFTAIIFLSTKIFNLRLSLTRYVLVFLLVLSADPIQIDIASGQFGLIACLFLTLYFYYQQKREYFYGGIMLGAAISIKFIGILFLPFLFFQREWKTLRSALYTVITLFVLSCLWVSISSIQSYFFEVLPHVSRIYGEHQYNISIWRVPNLLFPEAVSSEFPGVKVGIMGLLAIAVFLAVYRAARESRYVTLLALSCIISPISWVHYFSLLVPLLVVMAKESHNKALPLFLFGLFCCMDSVSRSVLTLVHDDSVANLELYAGIPLLTHFMLMVWLWRNEKKLLVVTDDASLAGVEIRHQENQEERREPKKLMVKNKLL